MQPGSARARPVLSSLPLQVLLYFGGWWDVAYFVLNVLIFVYKGCMLPYPSSKYAVEFTFVWLFLLVEPPRLFLASKGNLTEQPAPLALATLLAGPILAFLSYYLAFETYVLKIDVLLNAISIVFTALQVLLSGVAATRFIQAAKHG